MSKYNITRKLKDFDYTDVVAEETRTGTESLTFSNTYDADFKFMSISLQKDSRDGMHFENTRLNSGAEFEIVDSNGSVKQTFTIPTYLDKGDVYYPIIGKMKRSTGVVQDFTPVQLKQTSGANCTIKFKPKADYSDYALAQDTSFVNTPKVYPLQLCKDSVSIENLSKGSSSDWITNSTLLGPTIGKLENRFIHSHLYYQRAKAKFSVNSGSIIPNQIIMQIQRGILTSLTIDAVQDTEYTLSYIGNTLDTLDKQGVEQNVRAFPLTYADGDVTSYGKESMIIDLTALATASGDSFLDILSNAGYTTNAQIQAWCDTLPWIDPSTPLVLGKGQKITNLFPNEALTDSSYWLGAGFTLSGGKILLSASSGYPYASASRIIQQKLIVGNRYYICSRVVSSIVESNAILGLNFLSSANFITSLIALHTLSDTFVSMFGSLCTSSALVSANYRANMYVQRGQRGGHIYADLEYSKFKWFDATDNGLYSFALLLGLSTDALIKTWIDNYISFFTDTVKLGGVSEPCITAVATTSQEGFIKE